MNNRFLANAILFIMSQAAISCSGDSRQQKQPTENIAPSDSSNVRTSSTSNLLMDTLGKAFDNKKPFEVLSLVKGISSASTDEDSTKCAKWTISKNDLQKIIRNSKPISGTEWDLAYENLKCIIKAMLLQDGQKFELELNAGSWMWVHWKDTTLILGNDTKSDRTHFLSFPSNE